MPKQERAMKTRAAILDAAAAEFDAHGYDGARLDRIVERTGATKGAVYFHFPSKIAIARALREENPENWSALVAEVMSTGLRGIDAAAEITKRVGTIFAENVQLRAAMKLGQTIFPAEERTNPYLPWIDLVTIFVEQAIADGELSGVDAREFATIAIHAFFGSYWLANELGTLGSLNSEIEQLWRVLSHVHSGSVREELTAPEFFV